MVHQLGPIEKSIQLVLRKYQQVNKIDEKWAPFGCSKGLNDSHGDGTIKKCVREKR
jgi:hypothetical protein